MEYFIGGVVATLWIRKLQEQRPKPKERALVCNSLQQTYTKEKFTPTIYNWCLEYGPEDALAHFYTRLNNH